MTTIKSTLIRAGLITAFMTGSLATAYAQSGIFSTEKAPADGAATEEVLTCEAEIAEIDKVLLTAQIDTDTLAKVAELKEAATIKKEQGDEEGCLEDVKTIKPLVGLE